MLNGNCIKIDLDGLSNNVKQVVNNYNYNYKYYIGVVKSNAYGLGYYKVIETMEESGINYFAVSNLNEALDVRKYTNKGILILTPLFIDEIEACIKNDISVNIG
jgi:alanine racemase